MFNFFILPFQLQINVFDMLELKISESVISFY
jgi:hypothetical protein